MEDATIILQSTSTLPIQRAGKRAKRLPVAMSESFIGPIDIDKDDEDRDTNDEQQQQKNLRHRQNMLTSTEGTLQVDDEDDDDDGYDDSDRRRANNLRDGELADLRAMRDTKNKNNNTSNSRRLRMMFLRQKYNFNSDNLHNNGDGEDDEGDDFHPRQYQNGRYPQISHARHTSGHRFRLWRNNANSKKNKKKRTKRTRNRALPSLLFLGENSRSISWRQQWQLIKDDPRIVLLSFAIFSLLTIAGFALVYLFAKNQDDESREEALDLAHETGTWFADQLDGAILPLFSMAQFVNELEIFRTLHDQVGPADGPNSLPFVPSYSPGTRPTHRNITGVCDEPAVVQRFNDIASKIKQNANMDGILVNLQFLPYQVLCLIHPLVNYEDFPDGIVMNNTGVLGYDLLADPARREYAKNVIQGDGLYMMGPVLLRECQLSSKKDTAEDEDMGDDGIGKNNDDDGESVAASSQSACHVTVERAFIAALPVKSNPNEDPGQSIIVTDKDSGYTIEYPNTWGSVEAIINWNALVERSGIFERFDELDKAFRLSRMDEVFDEETNKVRSELVTLAETSDFDPDRMATVTTKLETSDDNWEITVAYTTKHTKWRGWALATVLAVSSSLALMTYTILIQNRTFQEMKKQYLEDLAHPQKLRLRQYLDDTAVAEPTAEEESRILYSKPIADFFASTTVIYIDIVGFSGWASEREPAQVFTLLQTMVFRFDKVARSRGVFKVETTGDCYVACCGIPDAQADHAVQAAKFAQKCIIRFNDITKLLEKSLGPATAELQIRVGLASGPVTAGVLDGERSKFHLYGDAVDLASRMRATSAPGMVHMSQSTADSLIQNGRKKWIRHRAEMTMIRGQGEVQSYWLADQTSKRLSGDAVRSLSFAGGDSGDEGGGGGGGDFDFSFRGDASTGSASDLWDDESAIFAKPPTESNKSSRLVEWLVESMSHLLKMVIAHRRAQGGSGFLVKPPGHHRRNNSHGGSGSFTALVLAETPLEEVQEVIKLPEFDGVQRKAGKDIEKIKLTPTVTRQLRALVGELSKLYHDNPFHNFEHACHVVMSVHKLLNRVVTPDDVNYQRKDSKEVASDLHDYTFGITSDPLTHLAVVFSALVHDIDHLGVSNGQLAKEKPELAFKYSNKSIAEQNSVDLAWQMFMSTRYEDLRKCICSTTTELQRFRQLVVNTVLATDIFDPQLKALRNLRWDRAFHHDELAINTLDETTTGAIIAPSSILGGKILFGKNDAFSSSPSPSSSSPPISPTPQKLNGAALKLHGTNRKATIVIEHLIQASDVAHTMQHWNIYKKWNERLYQEMYKAYKMGRGAVKDPSTGWYKGELWFFDNYVIPLSRKLEECGCFGVSSEECLFNAMENRRMWSIEGETIVKEMQTRVKTIPIRLSQLVEGEEDEDELTERDLSEH